jgi:hypothetical protein
MASSKMLEVDYARNAISLPGSPGRNAVYRTMKISTADNLVRAVIKEDFQTSRPQTNY